MKAQNIIGEQRDPNKEKYLHTDRLMGEINKILNNSGEEPFDIEYLWLGWTDLQQPKRFMSIDSLIEGMENDIQNYINTICENISGNESPTSAGMVGRESKTAPAPPATPVRPLSQDSVVQATGQNEPVSSTMRVGGDNERRMYTENLSGQH